MAKSLLSNRHGNTPRTEEALELVFFGVIVCFLSVLAVYVVGDFRIPYREVESSFFTGVMYFDEFCSMKVLIHPKKENEKNTVSPNIFSISLLLRNHPR
jgi:hypothetical protein